MIKNEKKISILYVVRLEPMISMLTAIRSIPRAKPDSDGYRIRKYITLKSILFIMFANLKLVLQRYTSLYGIFMSASLTLFCYNERVEMNKFLCSLACIWMTIIDSQLYIIHSLSLDVSLE